MLYLTAGRKTSWGSWLKSPTVNNLAGYCRPFVKCRYGFQSLEDLCALDQLPMGGRKCRDDPSPSGATSAASGLCGAVTNTALVSYQQAALALLFEELFFAME